MVLGIGLTREKEHDLEELCNFVQSSAFMTVRENVSINDYRKYIPHVSSHKVI
jgi:hypothetical protein